jgi:hypothetical protein
MKTRAARIGLACAVILAGCTRVHLTVWRAPNLPNQPYKKVLVCVSPKDAANALDIERAVVKAFASYPAAAGACLDVLPIEKHLTADQMAGTIRSQSFDAVLVVERESIIHWSRASENSSKTETLSEFLAAYAAGSKPDANPVKMNVALSNDRGGQLRHISGTFRLFDASTGQLVWRAQQAAHAPTALSVDRFVQDVAAHNLQVLAQDGLIPPAPVHN